MYSLLYCYALSITPVRVVFVPSFHETAILNSEIIAVHVEDPFSGTVYYTIRGGICIVQIWLISCKSGKLTSAPIAKNLPYAAMCAGTLGENYAGGTGSGIFMYINVNTNAICCHKAEDCHEFFGSFCYPVIK